MTYMLEGIRSVKKPYILTLMAIGLGCSILPAVSSSYMMRVFNITLITYLCVLSVYVLLGLCGQNSFAQAGLWGVGAYITANMVLKLGLGSAAAFIIATTGTAAFAFILGFAFFRLKQYYFTFASVGLMTILNGLFMNWVPVTGGALGISDIPVFSIAGFAANTENRKFFLILIVCMLASLRLESCFIPSDGHSWPYVITRWRPTVWGSTVFFDKKHCIRDFRRSCAGRQEQCMRSFRVFEQTFTYQCLPCI